MGDMVQWLTENWFNLFSSLGIIGGLWFTAISLHSETKTRRIANLLTITANYREVWKEFFRSPELARVIEPSADVSKQPVTSAEELTILFNLGRFSLITIQCISRRSRKYSLKGRSSVT
jgi:hypothetical protein